MTRNGSDSTGAGPSSTLLSAATRSNTFTNLRPGVSYTESVQAINAVGAGPAASATLTVQVAGAIVPVTPDADRRLPHRVADPQRGRRRGGAHRDRGGSGRGRLPHGVAGAVGGFNGSAGNVHVLVDVTGYIAGGTATADGVFMPITPSRIADSRSGQQIPGAVPASGTVEVQLTHRGEIPPDAAAVVLTVTAVAPTGSGFVTAWAAGIDRTTTSSLNFVAGQTIPNAVIVRVGTGGKIALYNGSGGSVHLLVDVSGYLRGGSPSLAGAFVGVTPARIADSRIPFQLGGALPGSGTAELQINGRGSVPATGVAAVVLNVTAVSPSDAGFLTVWPSGIPRTNTSNLNFRAGQTIPDMVIVQVGSFDSAGKISIFNGSAGPVQVVVDVDGYILFNGAAPA